MAGRSLKTRAEAFLKQPVNVGVLISRLCRTTELSIRLALGLFALGHN